MLASVASESRIKPPRKVSNTTSVSGTLAMEVSTRGGGSDGVLSAGTGLPAPDGLLGVGSAAGDSAAPVGAGVARSCGESGVGSDRVLSGGTGSPAPEALLGVGSVADVSAALVGAGPAWDGGESEVGSDRELSGGAGGGLLGIGSAADESAAPVAAGPAGDGEESEVGPGRGTAWRSAGRLRFCRAQSPDCGRSTSGPRSAHSGPPRAGLFLPSCNDSDPTVQTLADQISTGSFRRKRTLLTAKKHTFFCVGVPTSLL